MKFKTIVAPTITELFEQQIQNQILSGQVKPGEKLPTEAELSDIMKISKSAVHAGITNLERMGFLKISPRHGVYIADFTESGNVDTLIALLKYYNGSLDKHTIYSLLEAREALEGLATKLFISRCTKEDLEHLSSIIIDFKNQSLDTKPDTNTLAELACSFHSFICYKSGNNVIPLIVNGFHEINIVLWSAWIRQIGPDEAVKVLESFYNYISNKDEENAVSLFKKTADSFINVS